MRTRSHSLPGQAALALSAILLASAEPATALSYEFLIAPTGQPGDNFGWSVSSAGDMNNDGYNDIIVGADQAAADSGRADVYFGGAEVDPIPDITFQGDQASDYLGSSVSSAGDVNGDGYDDVIVGASGAGTGGEAYIFLGGSTHDAPYLTFFGEAEWDYFGRAVAGVGDVNGDGYDDVVVGASGNDAAGIQAGRIYLYLGGSEMDNVADLVVTGTAGDDYGKTVAAAGDMNADGFDDFVVGTSIVQWGYAHVHFGGSILDTIPDLILAATQGNDYFGSAVAGAGDVNADGYADVIVGAPYHDTTVYNVGRADVFYGGTTPDSLPDLSLFGGAEDDAFGESVASAGDVDGDGYDDFLVGAPHRGWAEGWAYLFLGGPDVDTTPDLTITGDAAGDQFGTSVAGAGDVNGDGLSDIVVGAYGNDSGGNNAGRAYVISISAPLTIHSPNGAETWLAGSIATVQWDGPRNIDIALSTDGGFSWSTLAYNIGGDDNTYSLLVPATPTEAALLRLSISGEPITPLNSDVSDAFFRILVPEPARPVAHRIQIAGFGEDEGDEFGTAVALAGDINGDGVDDFIVGAPKNDGGATNAGAAFLYVGGSDADGSPDLTLTGSVVSDYFGRAAAGAGDANGDGIGDFLVSAPQNDTGGSGAGQVYLYYGERQLDITDDVIFTGEAAGDWLGFAVSGAGDVNGDGYADYVISAPFHDTGGSDTGRVYLHLGSAIGNATADVIIDGEMGGDRLGEALAPAGDINSDGYDDFLIGAPDHDGVGRVYLHLGASSPDAVPDLVLDGESGNDRFGEAVSSAGDINGDGRDDFAVGAPDNNAGGSDAGRVYVCFGGSPPDSIPDLILTGSSVDEQFGSAVASAGDVNRDGYDDLLVGAPEVRQDEDRPGRIYLFLGGPAPDAVPAYEFIGATAGDGFGRAVSSAGDFNGDGFHDLLAGARQVTQEGDRPGYIRLYDFNRYHVLDPVRDEIWNVGGLETIEWLGEEPADVWLSADGGVTHEPLWMGVGGQDINRLQLRVPHLPTRFASVRITPSDAALFGTASCDSLFTIDASIVLMLFRVGPPPDGASGTLVSWSTEPGPEELTGYRLECARPSDGIDDWHTLLQATNETSHHDPTGGPGCRYRLTAINGLGEELLLGETRVTPLVPLAARPLPYREGLLTITFATAGGLGGGSGEAQVSLHDVAGRLVRTVASGSYPGGYQQVTWDGKDDQGSPAAAGVYFLRAVSGGRAESMKVIVVR